MRPLSAAVLLTLSSIACGDEVDVSFGSLSGNYEVDDDCFLRVSGSKGAGNCTWDDTEEDFVDKETGSVTFTLGESKIDFQGSMIDTFKEMYGGEVGWDQTCTSTAEASATKSSGRKESGMFAPIAGMWSGQIITYRSCHSESEDSTSSKTTTIHFSADIYGTLATVEFQKADDPDDEYDDTDVHRFSVVATPAGIEVDGHPIRRL